MRIRLGVLPPGVSIPNGEYILISSFFELVNAKRMDLRLCTDPGVDTLVVFRLGVPARASDMG